VPRNVEIKARIASVDAMVPIAAALSDHGPVPIAQDDTFFACGTGRLKLRDSACRRRRWSRGRTWT
jgi:adenylate cyclase